MKYCILTICLLIASTNWSMQEQEQPTDFLVQTSLTTEGKELQTAGLIIEKTLDDHIDRADSPEERVKLLLVRQMIKTQRHLLYAQEKGLLLLESQPQQSKLSRTIIIGGAAIGTLYTLSRL